ncbi:MAG: hypothetical protein JWO77_3907 [Ilumatobacteraceae bacterium]|nr:hypothetical protein [Ilumatobacteraceae bacterium]MDB5177431.1 hypothetical protein [Candidatus Saccharibacteria bacterium]
MTDRALKKLNKTIPEGLPRLGELCLTCVARRKSGKTTLLCKLVKAYAKAMNLVICLSPTVRLDKTWKQIEHLPNVLTGENVTNEVIMEIIRVQKERYLQDPSSHLLLILDDAGNDMRRKKLRQSVNVLYTTARHYGINLICSVQSLMHLEGTQITNSSQWAIWDTNQRQLKKICVDLSTSHMDEDDLQRFIIDNTKAKYSHVWINFLEDDDRMFQTKVPL